MATSTNKRGTKRARAESLTFTSAPKHWSAGIARLSPDQLRAVFYNKYKVGDYARYVGGDQAIRETNTLTILFYGPPGAGKSSLVNSIARVVNDEDDYNPFAPMNDEDPGRTTRTMYTACFPMGRGKDVKLGQVELWDTRGTWHVGHPEQDFANIRAFKLGKIGVGETAFNKYDDISESPILRDSPGSAVDDLVPVGGYRRAEIDLIVFVIDPSSGDEDQDHLRKIIRFMNSAGYQYQIILTKVDDYFEEWSNVHDEVRVKLHGIPANDTWGIENYRFDRAQRDIELDHNIFYVFLKLILAAELSLLKENRGNLSTPSPADLKNYVGMGMIFFLGAMMLVFMLATNLMQ